MWVRPPRAIADGTCGSSRMTAIPALCFRLQTGGNLANPSQQSPNGLSEWIDNALGWSAEPRDRASVPRDEEPLDSSEQYFDPYTRQNEESNRTDARAFNSAYGTRSSDDGSNSNAKVGSALVFDAVRSREKRCCRGLWQAPR